MDVWTSMGDGFAVGPSLEIKHMERVAVTVTAVWSDEDGVCVSLDSGDEPIPSAIAPAVATAVAGLASTPAPGRSLH